jgi:aspartyl-tRNA synthetase
LRLKRTCYCGEVNVNDIDKDVVLVGWVHKRRDHGGLIFVDMRDREGIIQIVFNPELSSEIFKIAKELRNEYVIAVKGKVSLRPEGTENSNIKTGNLEVLAYNLEILNRSKQLPFNLDEDVSENIRLKYRYIDLRREKLQENIKIRHKAANVIRRYLDSKGFIEIETPFLTKSTPEGARDFLVPSRLNPGTFYALPQSPQIFKQILMISGFDRYFQIVKCFRDEDLRADRQPEFTQIDMELSFIDREDIYEIVEGMFKELLKNVMNIDIESPFPRISYKESILRYGTDKPDTRYGLELIDITDVVENSEFKIFTEAIKKGGIVKGINAEGLSSYSRGEIDSLNEVVKVYNAKGLSWIKIENGRFQSPISKFFKEEEINNIKEKFNAKDGDLLLIIADDPKTVNDSLGYLRIHLAEKERLIDDKKLNFIWITDFPLLEYDDKEGRYVSKHHPFTSPLDEDLPLLQKEPLKVRAKAYDLVLNGSEIGGGSIRIHKRDIQFNIFRMLGINEEEAKDKFGFLLDALEYGAPPHGGIALGFDRIMMILCKALSIREVIPFPKTQKGMCLMSDAPSKVDFRQLKELYIKVDFYK